MVIVSICVGSSCHLKGAPEIIERLEKEVADNHLEDEVILTGSFCTGKCNRVGVTITVDDETFTGVTVENFREFWNSKILSRVDNV
ncbi:MAG: (2Fe-2S) ferredoxin domain-containing protein [Clostridia bacterium]|nr:(2Fe-2S) ferredoxin domain-containing protein [Clostridia bacterium]